MWDRRFLFSDDRVIDQIRMFVPFAGNTHHLQWRRTAESNWFMDTVRKVNLRGESGQTTQGFYVVDAAGDAYGFNNNRNVQIVLDFMKMRLLDFQNQPHEKVELKEQADSIQDAPAGTTVLRVYQRIIPVPNGADPANENVQRDHFWLLPEEAKQLSFGKAPESLGLRLCRFVFNDAIRGEPDMWLLQQVRKCEFKATREGNTVTLTGDFTMRTEDDSRGLEGKLHAEVLFAQGKVTGFKGIADATAWGQSTYTPNPPSGKFPLKFAFILAPDAKDTVAPQATFFGNEYLTGR